jgi:hypothetical protein
LSSAEAAEIAVCLYLVPFDLTTAAEHPRIAEASVVLAKQVILSWGATEGVRRPRTA